MTIKRNTRLMVVQLCKKHKLSRAVSAALYTGTAALLSMSPAALPQSNFDAMVELSDLDLSLIHI